MVRRGQNFLVDELFINKIISCMDLAIEDNFFEIGCGEATLTTYLVDEIKYIIAVDIDYDLIKKARFNLKDRVNLSLICGDILDLRMDNLHSGFRIFGNIPYYITNPIIKKIIFEYWNFEDIHLTVQKGVGERLSAEEENSSYGIMTALLGAYVEVESQFTIPDEAFYPVPEVNSSFIRITKLSEPLLDIANWESYFKFLQDIFHQKRKTLLNNLSFMYEGLEKDYLFERYLKPHNITKMMRAEDIDTSKLIGLYRDVKGDKLL